jgi:hypothetical protein
MTIVHYFYTTYSSAMSQCLYLQHYKKNRNFRRSALQEKKKNCPHLPVCSLSRGGPWGLCRHPEDRVPPHTSSKSRQGAGRASTRCHVSCSFGPHLPAEVSSGTATFPAAPAPMLPHGPEPRLLAELSSGAVTCSSAPDLASLSRCALALPRVPWLRTLPPQEESSAVATCSSAPDLVSLPRWALTLPHGPGLASPRGELQCYHVPTPPAGCGPQE